MRGLRSGQKIRDNDPQERCWIDNIPVLDETNMQLRVPVFFMAMSGMTVSIFNLFAVHALYAFCRKRLDRVPEGTQLFLLTRLDFGTYLYLFHYVQCWEKLRGKTCVVVLTPNFRAPSNTRLRKRRIDNWLLQLKADRALTSSTLFKIDSAPPLAD